MHRPGWSVPGLVNAHTHSPENLARGRSERTRLPEWREAIWPALDALAADRLTIAIEVGAAEMIPSRRHQRGRSLPTDTDAR